MGQEEQFDSFYAATRRALVHQTFALTGDLSAAQSAVRDAYIAAWHHWRKASSREDPQDWVRPRAWQLAQRRHTARLWHRSKGISTEDKRVLDALGKLSLPQRRALLLTQLAGLPIADAARELNLSQEQVEKHLQAGTAALAMNLDIDSAALRVPLVALADAAQAAKLPRPSIVRRAGAKRRRSHTTIAAFAAAFVAIASGAFAHEPDAVPPTVDPGLVQTPAAEPSPSTSPVEGASALPTADDLLTARQISGLGRQPWRVVRTHDNTSGDGLNTVCQQARFADPDGLSTLVREFKASGKPRRSATQTLEISESVEQAEKAFDSAIGWYAGCQVGRYQLLRAFDIDGVGDQAALLVVRVWEQPITTYSVAIAQVGQVVTWTVGETIGSQPTPPKLVVDTLATSVQPLCEQSGDALCAIKPRVSAVPPPPSGEEPGLLAVADLPPAGSIKQPWVGTSAKPARKNPSATTCDRANFARHGAVKTRSRTFLIPGARLPARFGLSETIGVFESDRDASKFLGQVRDQVARCEDRNLSTQVYDSRSFSNGRTKSVASTWRLETEVSDNETVEFRLGFVRVGKRVAQLTFAPAGSANMTATDFRTLVLRAGERLGELS